jgi:superfamily II DNA or RNA helicase
LAAQFSPNSFVRALHRVESLERRIRTFEGLGVDEQRILTALAVFVIPTPRSPVVDLCRALELNVKGQNLDASRLSHLANHWQKLDLVVWDGTTLDCEPDFGTYAIRFATESPTWKRPNDVGFMRALVGLQRRSTTESTLSEARLLRLAGRDVDAGKQAAKYLETPNSTYRIGDLFGPGDPWFVPQHVPYSEVFLPARLRIGTSALLDHDWYLELFDGMLSADPRPGQLLLRMDAGYVDKLEKVFKSRSLLDAPNARSLWYLWQVLQGNAERVQQRAHQDASAGVSNSLGYVAVLELARGNVGPSLELFERAWGVRKPNDIDVLQLSWVGAFHVLALLVSGTEPHLTQAEFLIKKLIGKGSRDAHSEVPYAHYWLSKYLQHLTGRPLPNLKSSDHAFEHPASYLMRLLVAAWFPAPDRSFWANEAELNQVQLSAQTLGYHWFKRELTAIQHRLQKERKHSELVISEQGTLVALVKHKEPWEQTLDSLVRLAAKDSLAKAPKESVVEGSERLAWCVHEYSGQLHVEARLQSRKSSGYGRGRPVALQRLLPPVDPTLPINARDRAIIDHLSLRRYAYGRDEISFGDGVALALVGHPHVFDSLDGLIHYQVKQGQIQLRCEQTDSGYRLRLEPSLTQGMAHAGLTMTSFVQTNGTDLVVYAITPAVGEVAKLLGPALTLPEAGEAQLKALLPRLSSLLPTTASMTADDGAQAQPGDSTPVLRIRPKAEGLRVQLLVTPFGPKGQAHCPGEGPVQLSDYRDGQARQVCRDTETELQRARDVVAMLPSLQGASSGDFVWIAPDLVGCLALVSELSQLADRDARVEWPEGQPLRLKRLRTMVVSITGGDAARWFEADGTLQFSDGVALRIAEILRLLDRASGRFVRLSNGDYAELTRDALERLELLRSFQVNAEDTDTVRVAPWLALAMPAGDDPDSDQGDAQWRQWRNRVKLLNKRPILPAKAFTGELRDYQSAGFAWLCRMASLETGVCLADDMGLGKTVQALGLLQYRACRKVTPSDVTGPLLIVAPASVCPNWLSEAARFTPNLEPRWFTGADRTLQGLTRKTLVVCTYEILHRDRDALAKITWDTVVLDEAQQIKNAHTRRAKAAFALKAGFRLATTGTPIENHLGELWSLFHFLMPGLLGDQHEFVERFRSPIENARDPVRRQQLQALIRPFVLRRTKGQVLSELPPRTELVRRVQLSEPEIELYEAIRQRGLETLGVPAKDGNQQRIRVLAELMRLRRACCHPRLVLEESEIGSSKLAALLDLVTELREAGHRALVFSQFVDHLSLVREALDDLGVSYAYLDGSTPLGERARRIEAFQSGEGDLFLISLRAGGTGLNLTAADYVIHLDPWWNPAVEDQASDRAHRIGQERPVTIYRLVTQGTIEERLVAMHAVKRTLVADILEGTEGTKRLDPDDLMNLLRDAAMTRRATMRPAG